MVRIDDVETKKQVTFGESVTSASADNNSIFRDSADDEIKIKDNTGTVNPIVIGNAMPVGSILPWFKGYFIKQTGSNTSSGTNQLIDTSATFQTNGVTTEMGIYVKDDVQANTTSTNTGLKTISFSAGTNGIQTDAIIFEGKTQYAGFVAQFNVTFYYTDATDSTTDRQYDTGHVDSLTNWSDETQWQVFTFKNPEPTKTVWRIQINGGNATDEFKGSSGGTVNCRNMKVPIKGLQIVTVVDENTLTLNSDVFDYVTGLEYGVYVINTLGDGWLECNGQTVSDAESPLNGMALPNLNDGDYRWLKGGVLAGQPGGSQTHMHVTPFSQNNDRLNMDTEVREFGIGRDVSTDRSGSSISNSEGQNGYMVSKDTFEPMHYTVVWIMRIK